MWHGRYRVWWGWCVGIVWRAGEASAPESYQLAYVLGLGSHQAETASFELFTKCAVLIKYGLEPAELPEKRRCSPVAEITANHEECRFIRPVFCQHFAELSRRCRIRMSNQDRDESEILSTALDQPRSTLRESV